MLFAFLPSWLEAARQFAEGHFKAGVLCMLGLHMLQVGFGRGQLGMVGALAQD